MFFFLNKFICPSVLSSLRLFCPHSYNRSKKRLLTPIIIRCLVGEGGSTFLLSLSRQIMKLSRYHRMVLVATQPIRCRNYAKQISVPLLQSEHIRLHHVEYTLICMFDKILKIWNLCVHTWNLL